MRIRQTAVACCLPLSLPLPFSPSVCVCFSDRRSVEEEMRQISRLNGASQCVDHFILMSDIVKLLRTTGHTNTQNKKGRKEERTKEGTDRQTKETRREGLARSLSALFLFLCPLVVCASDYFSIGRRTGGRRGSQSSDIIPCSLLLFCLRRVSLFPFPFLPLFVFLCLVVFLPFCIHRVRECQ